MECKDVFSRGRCLRFSDLIDTLWNVKADAAAGICDCALDLIDTLWNVKMLTAFSAFIHVSDLIDTLWNVKYYAHVKDEMFTARFNRYIVECKGK